MEKTCKPKKDMHRFEKCKSCTWIASCNQWSCAWV